MPSTSRLAWSWTLVILVLCWIPRFILGGIEGAAKPILAINPDKLIHMGIFAVFSFLWMRVGTSSRRVWWVLAAGLALAILSELGQAMPIVNRDCNLADGLADSVGVVVGLLGSWLSRKYFGKPVALAEV